MKKKLFFLIIAIIAILLTISFISQEFSETESQPLQTVQTDAQADVQTEEYIYNKKWYEQDRKHFEELLENRFSLKDTVYEEYITLNGELAEINKKAYHDQKRYTLYSPELTEAYNVLVLAINAREKLLEDLACGEIKSFDSYYPQYLYSFIEYSSRSNDFNDEIQSIERFKAYDQEQIVAALDKLPLPDYYFYGLKIFFINDSTSFTKTHYFANRTRGFFDNYITVFNYYNSTEELIQVLIHEIGHAVQEEIFYTYKIDDDFFISKQENNQAILDYAEIYNQSEYYTSYAYENTDEWAGSLFENFAEDFSNIYAEKPKKTAWKGDRASDVKTFIEEKIAQIDVSKVTLFKEARVISGQVVSDITLGRDLAGEYNFYTKNSTVNIKFEKMIANGNKIEAEVFLDDYHKIVPMDSENQITLQLPKEGKYDVFIVTNASNKPSLGITIFFKLTVIYDSK